MMDGGEPASVEINAATGPAEPLGVTPRGDGVDVAVYSAHGEEVFFCLYDAEGRTERARVRLLERTGDVFHGHVAGVGAGARYGLRVRGPWAPWAGHRFNESKLLLDPYATAIDRPFVLHRSMFDSPPGADRPNEEDSGLSMPKAIVGRPDPAPAWAGTPAWDRTSIAEVHVRGFSKLHPGVAESLRGTFGGLASPAALDHFGRLGITTVELMPAAAWVDERHLGPLGLTNYWGYNPVAWMTPDPRLAPGGWAEVRDAVEKLHAAGLEVLLDVVYNHSGEGDAFGPTLSLRGLDNASYYRLEAGDPSRYVNDAGCGNILDATSPPVVRLVLDSLRAWARFGGIDGFRFDLMPVLGRRADGFDARAPIIAAIEQDPLLRGLKLVAEPWDVGPGGYQVGAFGGRWGEWNDRFRDAARRFWGGRGSAGELATRLSGSSDLFGAKRRPSRSVNYVDAHDGFTIADVVSYAHKHNAENGEDNRDGTDANWSWNNGVEGPTQDPGVLALRDADVRNLLATLLLSRGTPMLGPGAELGHTQFGNNNAYAQDNATAWLDWSRADHPLIGFIHRLLELRVAHPALTHDRFLSGMCLDGVALADVEWRLPDGGVPQSSDWDLSESPTLIGILSAPGRRPEDPPDRVTLVLHAGNAPISVRLPDPRSGWGWHLEFDTAAAGDTDRPCPEGGDMVAARTVALFAEREARPDPGRGTRDEAALNALAAAAGIAPEWFEVSGHRHRVSPETKRALLASMGLPAGSAGELRDSLVHLSDRRLRGLPETLTAHAGSAVTLDVLADRLGGRTRIVIRREDGSEERFTLDIDGAERHAVTAPDGRSAIGCRVTLPAQPPGRHRVLLGDDPSVTSRLTVAPRRCFTPAAYREGRRGFGVSAHLYTLRRTGDGGVGDFTTLGLFAEETARHGGDFVGLNPMHAQFPADRERTSPYNPSDRRFLDPLYIDVAVPGILGETPEVGRILGSRARLLARLRAGATVDYASVWAVKAEVLEIAFASFDARRRRNPRDLDVADFDGFVSAGGPTLHGFTLFQAIAETLPRRPWWDWDAGLVTPGCGTTAAFAERHADRLRFHAYCQWMAAGQFGAAAERGRAAGLRLGFYRDIAVGTAPDGAEAWAGGESFARGVSVGAPPDPFSADGQVWSLPPPNPVAAPSDAFAALLAANMRQAGALRIDHAMGLQRLFWVPDGARGADGAYVGYALDRNLADVSLESHRAQCLVIGEDLGTVPEGFRDRLEASDVLSYRVMLFERDGLRFKPPAAYPVKSVACVATHDLPTLAGWWTGADYAEREAIGHMSGEAAARAAHARVEEKREFASAVGLGVEEGADMVPRDMVASAHRFVADSSSMLAVAQADDLVGEAVAVNLPGTSHERPNWQRKLAVDVTEIFAAGDLPRRERGPALDP